MKINKQDIRLFRIVSIVFCLISISIIIFFSNAIGFPLLAVSLFSLFAPYKDGDDIRVLGYIKRASENESEWGIRPLEDVYKFIVSNYQLNSNERDLLNLIYGFVILPISLKQDKINENVQVRIHSFFYLLGVINACCKIVDAPAITFYKICYNLFFYDLRKKGLNYYEFADNILKNYNQYSKLIFFKNTMLLGEQATNDNLDLYDSTRMNFSSSYLTNLLSEWEELKPENYSPEIKIFFNNLETYKSI